MHRIFNTLIFTLLAISIALLINPQSNLRKTINVNEDKIANRWLINIPKINLYEMFNLTSIKSKIINGVVLFDEYGRPDEKYTNTIIGAHSGTGPNALFNNIDILDIGDKIIIYYERVYFTYSVVKKYQVFENDLSPLNKDRNKTLLTLITCNKNNSKKRLIVVSEQL